MKMKITIYHEKYDENVVEIEINNGNWKYWDSGMECYPHEKITLTMNNIIDARYLAQPVKDEIQHYDWEEYRKTGEIIETRTTIRTYDSLHEYLVCRINNAKDDYKRFLKFDDPDYKHFKYECVLFDEVYVKLDEQDIAKDIVYKGETALIVRIDFE